MLAVAEWVQRADALLAARPKAPDEASPPGTGASPPDERRPLDPKDRRAAWSGTGDGRPAGGRRHRVAARRPSVAVSWRAAAPPSSTAGLKRMRAAGKACRRFSIVVSRAGGE